MVHDNENGKGNIAYKGRVRVNLLFQETILFDPEMDKQFLSPLH